MYCRKSERYQVKKIDCNVCDHIFSGHVFISELNHITSYFSWSSNYYVHTLFFTLSFGPYYADNWIINQRESWFCVFIFIHFFRFLLRSFDFPVSHAVYTCACSHFCHYWCLLQKKQLYKTEPSSTKNDDRQVKKLHTKKKNGTKICVKLQTEKSMAGKNKLYTNYRSPKGTLNKSSF